jgi:triacylglycerol lipase
MRKPSLGLITLAVCGGVMACSASDELIGSPDSGLMIGPGSDAGSDAGADAGQDAGPDAGMDAGPDAGPDAGQDAGPDAGNDAGYDGDAGPVFVFSDAGFLFGDGGLHTKYPVILAHGFGTLSTTGAMFHLVLGALQDAGVEAFPDTTDAFNTTQACGAELLTTIQTVLAMTGASKVNIIAHSMGGLDARYVISSGGLNQGNLVASLSTVSTPHQGSEMADFTLMFAELGIAPSVIGSFESAFGIANLSDPDVIACLQSLSVASAPAFNATTPNDPNVMYQSWAGVATAGGISDANIPIACNGEWVVPSTQQGTLETLFVPIALIIAGTDDDVNDGFVPVSSARWGTFRGCIPEDHLGEPGGTLGGDLPDPDPVTGYDYVGFFTDIVRDLSARGY